MKIEEELFFSIIEKLKKEELLGYLKVSFNMMNENQRRIAFEKMYQKEYRKTLTPQNLFSEVEIFIEESYAGEYYDPFMIDSKNFMDIPPKTDEWFFTLSFYLDESARLVSKKEFVIAIDCFEKLFDLIDQMESGEEIIFAHEYGTWMITSELDYQEAYIIGIAAVENATIFASKIIPILQRDVSESLSGGIYGKIRKHATPQQFEAVEQVIQSDRIQVKKREY